MAFVNRSQRKLTQSKSETKSIGPGEYLDNENEFNRDKSNKASAPFNSQANRITVEIPYDQRIRNIGPGSYDNKPPILKKSFSTKNLECPSLINHTMFKLIEKTKQIKVNNWKEIKENLRINYERKGERAETDKKNENSASNKSKLYIKYIQSTNTSNRVCSIPCKNNYGYDFDKNDNIYLIEDPSQVLRHSGTKNDSVSPNEYFLKDKDKKKNVRGVDWSRSSSKMTQGNTNRNATANNNNNTANNINNNTFNNTQTLPISEQTTKVNDYIKEKSFRLFQNVKNPIRGLKKVHSTEDIVIEDILKNTPGPGYYFSEDHNGNKPNKSIEKVQKTFGIKSERPMLLSNYYNNPNIGPGSYNKESFIPKRVNFFPFVRKEKTVQPSPYIHSNPYLGPGSYIPKKMPKKTMSLYYGTLDRRFKQKNNENNIRPGPGEYIELSHWGKRDSSPSLSYKEQKIVDYVKKGVPGIGMYHPDIVSSIEYKIKTKENILQSFIAPFSSGEERFNLLQPPKIIPGPGDYHREPSKIKLEKKQLKKFSGNYPLKSINEGDSVVGPGSYEQDNYQWNKRSFNILFV